MAHIVRMPEVAAGTGSAEIQSWLVAAGDDIAVGQPVCEIETEKAVVDLESEVAGVFAGVLVAAGVSTTVGSAIGVIAAEGEDLAEALASAGGDQGGGGEASPPESKGAGEGSKDEVADSAPDVSGNAAPPSLEVATEASEDKFVDAEPNADDVAAAAEASADVVGGRDKDAGFRDGRPERLFASPLVRRLAKEYNLDLSNIRGSGPNGRILKKDLGDLEQVAPQPQAAPAEASPVPAQQPPKPQASTSGPSDDSELVPHTGMRRAIAKRLSESKATVPHFYVVADCNVDELLALRARVNEQAEVKISVNDFVMKAAAQAMLDVPAANAIWEEDGIRRFTAVDIAVAVSVENGLLTPVVRGVEGKSLGRLNSEIRDLSARARNGALKQRELEGGSFTVSNLGMYGTREFSAIINPPHAGILAVGAASERVVVIENEMRIANVMTVTLSADHRVLDGALAAEWLAAFQRRIENPMGLLI